MKYGGGFCIILLEEQIREIMLYLTLGDNEIPNLCSKIYSKLVLIDQITKKEYSYSLALAECGNWYILTLSEAIPVGQYDVHIIGDEETVFMTMLAQYGEFERANTEYQQTHDVRAYNG